MAYYYAADALSGGSVRNRNLGLLTGLGTEGLNTLFGGGLFGTSSHITDTGLALSVINGGLSASDFTDTESKKPLFGGTSHDESTSPADEELTGQINATLQTGIQSVLAGTQGLGVTAAQALINSFSESTKISLQGKSQDEIQQAIQDWLDKTLGDMAKAVLSDSRYAGLVKNASKDMTDALLSLGEFFAANPLSDAAEVTRQANRTVKEVFDDQRQALLQLTATYDGSTLATQNLATASQALYTQEITYLNQITSVRSAVTDTLSSSIDAIRQSVMTPAQQYAYLNNEVAGWAGQLNVATDPQVIQTLVQEINTAANQAYGLIPDADKQAYAQQYIDSLTKIQNTADDQLVQAQNTALQQHQDIMNTIQQAMISISDTFKVAAQEQRSAAQALKDAAQTLQEALSAAGYYNYGDGKT